MSGELLYPVMLRLTGKRVAVVGGGRVALRRVEGLLAAGASIRVIAPEAVDEIRGLAASKKLEWIEATFSAERLRGSQFVVCATDSPEVNRQAAWAAKALGAFVNMAAPPTELGDFIVPAIARHEELVFSVSTGGGSPELSRQLLKELQKLADACGPLLPKLVSLRNELRQRFATSEERRAFWRRLLSEEVMAKLREGNRKEAEEMIEDAITGSGIES